MKYGKILTAFMLALAMCLGLTACGGDNGGDSNDNNDSIQTPPPVIEGAAYDSAADASAYGEYYGLWEGSSGAKCDTLAVRWRHVLHLLQGRRGHGQRLRPGH